MRKIIDRIPQKITSAYGMRNGRKHKGVDLRSYTDDFSEKLPVMLPEDCIFVREVWQEKWGWTYIFKPIESFFTEIKFTHVGNTSMEIGATYRAGDKVGFTMRTDYMVQKKYGEHLHFETWGTQKKRFTKSKKIVPVNPVIYFDIMGVEFE